MSDERIIKSADDNAAAPPPPELKGLRNRLKIKSPMVRKIAIIDLIKLHESIHTSDVPQALTAHLEKEDHPPLQLRVISFLVHAHYKPALDVMEKLASDEETDASVKTALADAMEKLRKG